MKLFEYEVDEIELAMAKALKQQYGHLAKDNKGIQEMICDESNLEYKELPNEPNTTKFLLNMVIEYDLVWNDEFRDDLENLMLEILGCK